MRGQRHRRPRDHAAPSSLRGLALTSATVARRTRVTVSPTPLSRHASEGIGNRATANDAPTGDTPRSRQETTLDSLGSFQAEVVLARHL